MEKTLEGNDEIDADISTEVSDAITHVVITWGMFDTALTQFTLSAFSIPLEEGSILIGAMDTRTKLERLRALYIRHKMPEAAKSIADLARLHRLFVPIRNALAHSAYMGRLRDHPNVLMFSNGKFSSDHSERMVAGVGHSFAEMKGAAHFALHLSDKLMEHVAKHQWPPSKPPQEPPLIRVQMRPNPQKSGEGKRNRRPPPSEA